MMEDPLKDPLSPYWRERVDEAGERLVRMMNDLPPVGHRPRPVPLTPVEEEVLRLHAEGLSEGDINLARDRRNAKQVLAVLRHKGRI